MMFDRDGDGKIGREEFEEIYSKLDPSSEYRDAKKLFDIVDMNKNGVIDFTEW
jgi:Ca2+-binding EF-hand superfamily protein